MWPRLHGWEAQDSLYNAKQPFLCDCGARYLLKETVVARAFDQFEPADRNAGLGLACDVNRIIYGLER